MLYLYSLILAVILATAAATAVPDSDSVNVSQSQNKAERCQCYVVSGPDPGYFQNYRFYDFRSINPGEEWKDNPRHPANTTSLLQEEMRLETPTSPEKVPLTNGDWDSQAWRREGSRLFPVPIQNSPRNVFISQDEAAGTPGATYLTMRTMRHQDSSSTAEIVTQMKNFLHCSVRIRLRLLSGNNRVHPASAEGVNDGNTSATTTSHSGNDSSTLEKRLQQPLPPQPGAVAGIFTYHSFTSESDIEILTSDPPNQVRYVNQPSYDPVAGTVVPGAGTTVSNLPSPWTEWSTHRLDWFPDISRWYVNNIETATKTYGVPHDPSVLVMNLWSDGGVWSGNLTVGTAVHLGIEWIEIAYNTSGPVEGPADRKSRGEADNNFRFNTNSESNEHNKREEISSNANVCNVGCRIDDPNNSNGLKNLGNPQVAWDNNASSKRYKGLFEPVVILNPFIISPQSGEIQSSGRDLSHGRLSWVSLVVLAVAGVVGTNFLSVFGVFLG